MFVHILLVVMLKVAEATGVEQDKSLQPSVFPFIMQIPYQIIHFKNPKIDLRQNQSLFDETNKQSNIFFCFHGNRIIRNRKK